MPLSCGTVAVGLAALTVHDDEGGRSERSLYVEDRVDMVESVLLDSTNELSESAGAHLVC